MNFDSKIRAKMEIIWLIFHTVHCFFSACISKIVNHYFGKDFFQSWIYTTTKNSSQEIAPYYDLDKKMMPGPFFGKAHLQVYFCLEAPTKSWIFSRSWSKWDIIHECKIQRPKSLPFSRGKRRNSPHTKSLVMFRIFLFRVWKKESFYNALFPNLNLISVTFYAWICVKRGTTQFIVMLLIHSRRGGICLFLSEGLFICPPMQTGGSK